MMIQINRGLLVYFKDAIFNIDLKMRCVLIKIIKITKLRINENLIEFIMSPTGF